VGEFLVFSSLIMINLALRTYSINANTVIDEDHHYNYVFKIVF
jgi:hypothetical protein